MANSTGHENASVNERLEQALLTRGEAFSFLQAYRTLARLVKEQGGNPDHDIRIRPALSLELPKAAISGIKRMESSTTTQFEIQTSFLGLYGASSPLPNFYTEDLIAAEQEDEIQARLLLDVFHQRIYRLYVSVLQKYQPVYELTESSDSHFLKMLWGLVGLRDENARKSIPQPGLFLRYVNLFARQQQSASGLQYMLADYLQALFPHAESHPPVNIEQCVEQKIEIPVRDRLMLGQGKALGINTVVGRYISDYSGKILIQVGPIELEMYQTLMSDAGYWQGLSSLIRSYIGPALTCELEFSVAFSASAGATLGNEDWNKMGLTTWLNSPSTDREGSEHSSRPLLVRSRIRLH